MKYLLFLIFCLFNINVLAQWNVLNITGNNRFDDVFFIDDSTGYTSEGYDGNFYKTINGGLTWQLKYEFDEYIRSIEFVSTQIGYCGSLDSALYKTIDGGNTWIDITNLISPKPPGICGLSAPEPNVIYGCGKWSSPAFVIKSLDGGNTWTTYDLSNLAESLIDVHFINKDSGFVTGTSINTLEGGIILYTADGGNSWAIKHKTMVPNDRVWKIQSPNGINFFASVESQPIVNNVRILKSVDMGHNWSTIIVDSVYNYMQTVGFIDSLKGWTGGESILYETQNGGLTWSKVVLGQNYNRFFKVNDSTAFLSGQNIYKYKSSNLSYVYELVSDAQSHTLSIKTNPVYDYLWFDIEIKNKTACLLNLFDFKGKKIFNIFQSQIEKGNYNYKINIEHYPAQAYLLILNTNEGMTFKKLVKK